MKPFSKNKTLKIIFFLELILIFSIVSSFFILNIIKEKNTGFNKRVTDHRNLYKNYKILKYFLDLESHLFLSEDTPEIPGLNVNDPFVVDILKLRSAKSFLENKKPRLAFDLLIGLNSKYGYINREKNKLYLRYLYSQKRYSDFTKHYNPELVNNFEIKLLLINCLEKTKKGTEAFTTFKNLFKEKNMDSFQKMLPRYTLRNYLKKLGYQFWFEKFQFLLKKNDFREFLIESKYFNAPQLISLFRAEFDYKRGRYERSKRFLNRITAEQLLNDKKRLGIKINIRLGNFNDVIKQIKELKNDHSLHPKLLFNSASILLIKKELDLSLNLFLKYIQLIELDSFEDLFIINNQKYWKSLWLSAWMYLRKNDKNKAVYFFKKGSRSSIAPYRIANSYWLYKLGNGDPKIIENYPFSYYYTKVVRTSIPDKGLQRFVGLINHKQSPSFVEIVEDLKSLLKYQLVKECFDFLNWAQSEAGLTDSDKNVLNIIKSIFYLKQQNFYRAFFCLRTGLKDYLTIRLPRFLRSLYSPVKYLNWINLNSQIAGVDRMLIYAMIRDESFFRADVVSPSGACGLMQLMLQTAKKVGNKHGMKIRRRDLFKPEINLKLGIAYFKYLTDKYNGKLHLAVAAYNAGDHRVDRWINEFGNVSDDQFIEMIPFTETRNYVKNVFRNYYYYRFYYGKKKLNPDNNILFKK